MAVSRWTGGCVFSTLLCSKLVFLASSIFGSSALDSSGFVASLTIGSEAGATVSVTASMCPSAAIVTFNETGFSSPFEFGISSVASSVLLSSAFASGVMSFVGTDVSSLLSCFVTRVSTLLLSSTLGRAGTSLFSPSAWGKSSAFTSSTTVCATPFTCPSAPTVIFKVMG
ncbi:uncharacterized protein LY89DRAFT_54620 [Mollisia scopiformis]|uniref:Secreted protein n=1 Tax=Mollisia scopiformis TaxID=149040 RepID=A0A194XBG2_MOLSC|nr:uncharacterized protein LY89DRAFT_54620 [Mollisia scopiformis]KUJ17498.1 hypothetical protein LY89DRAFT_54620 [Mollisia scopiformis]